MGGFKVLNEEAGNLFFDVLGLTMDRLGFSKEGFEIEACPSQTAVPQPDGKTVSFSPGKDLCKLSKPPVKKKKKMPGFSMANDIFIFKKITQYDPKNFATSNLAGDFSSRMSEPDTHCYEVYDIYPKGAAGKWMGIRPNKCGEGNFVERTVFCGKVTNDSSAWTSYGISYYCMNASEYDLLELLLNQSISRK